MLAEFPAFSLRPQAYRHFIYLFGVRHIHQNTHVEVKGQFARVIALLSPCGSGELNPGLQAWLQAPSPDELSQQLSFVPLSKLGGRKNSLTCPVQLLAAACIAQPVVPPPCHSHSDWGSILHVAHCGSSVSVSTWEGGLLWLKASL